MNLEQLQIYWWIVFSLVGSLFGFLLFVQGGQSFIFSFGKQERAKLLLVNLLGRKWELCFTTLVLFGGVAFAAFPRFYAVSFGGAYWLWLVVLVSSVLQAVSYEYRKKEGNLLGSRVFEFFLLVNGFVLSAGVGVFVATLYSGNAFILTDSGTGLWQNRFLGLEAFFNVFNLLLGLSVLFLSRILALFYFYAQIVSEDLFDIKQAIYKKMPVNFILFLVFFLPWLVWLLFRDGVCQKDSVIAICSHQYLFNLLDMPILFGLLVLGVVLFLVSVFLFFQKKRILPLWFGGVGAILVYFSVLLNVGLHGSSFYPSTVQIADSLFLSNSSSSLYTLKTMFYVSFLVPFVLGYIVYVWYKMDDKKLSVSELESDKNSY